MGAFVQILGRPLSLPMPRRREIRGVLDNTLTVLASRHSDHDGYWLFGFLVPPPGRHEVDLLAPMLDDPPSPGTSLARRARAVFRDQWASAGLPTDWAREAVFTLTTPPERTEGLTNGRWRPRYSVTFEARVVTDLRRTYSRSQVHLVAPHDPGLEIQSIRAMDLIDQFLMLEPDAGRVLLPDLTRRGATGQEDVFTNLFNLRIDYDRREVTIEDDGHYTSDVDAEGTLTVPIAELVRRLSEDRRRA